MPHEIPCWRGPALGRGVCFVNCTGTSRGLHLLPDIGRIDPKRSDHGIS